MIPTFLARLSANKRLIEACYGFETEKVRQALADGADPNHEMFEKNHYERIGTSFDVKQWWGGRRNEPILGSRQENYWTTPLSVAVSKNNREIIDILLDAGANPWAMGCGSSGYARPSPFSCIFIASGAKLHLLEVLDRHFEHVIDTYPPTSPVAAHNNLASFREIFEGNEKALAFLGKLESHLAASQLSEGVMITPPPRLSPRSRL